MHFLLQMILTQSDQPSLLPSLKPQEYGLCDVSLILKELQRQ
jgi:hypothetical protein